jgi:aryl sulfotransferase
MRCTPCSQRRSTGASSRPTRRSTGCPANGAVSYLVGARHPLDMAVSLYHQGDNIDRDRLQQLTGAPPSGGPASSRLPLRPWLERWIEQDSDPRQTLDSLPGVMWHLSDAWRRRSQANVLLVHYDDLLADLDAQMHRVATWLGIQVAADRWPWLVEAATFTHMRQRADAFVPDTAGVLKNSRAFFRQGRSGTGSELLSPTDLARYHRLTSAMAPPDLLRWLHRRQRPTGQPAGEGGNCNGSG